MFLGIEIVIQIGYTYIYCYLSLIGKGINRKIYISQKFVGILIIYNYN